VAWWRWRQHTHTHTHTHTHRCYWVLSVLDFYSYTGNKTVLANHAPMVAHLLTNLLSTVLSNPDPHSGQPGLGFVGWDDRTGGGFSNSSCVECELDFRMLLLRAVNESAKAYADVNATLASTLASGAAQLVVDYRKPVASSGAEWHTQLLLSSASDAVNAGLTTKEEEDALFDRLFSDSITICQLSPFNTCVALPPRVKQRLCSTMFFRVLLCSNRACCRVLLCSNRACCRVL
jgi:alpha-L-rhamnosidase